VTDAEVRGRVHSFETMGALDGPGLRVVVFLQGCRLRCRYCHNPDTWDPAGGEELTAAAVVARVERYRPYFADEGGVTISGGEPLLQPAFAAAVLAGCRAASIHTVVDTAGVPPDPAVDAVLAETDLLLLDLKHPDPDRHRELTGRDLAPTLSFLDHALEAGIDVWVRHVVVPGWNDRESDMERLAACLAPRAGRLARVQLLPYHTMAAEKWEALGRTPPLAETPPLEADRLAALAAALAAALPVPVTTPAGPAPSASA
jgi:pyruvate formate lyase activating enzyme